MFVQHQEHFDMCVGYMVLRGREIEFSRWTNWESRPSAIGKLDGGCNGGILIPRGGAIWLVVMGAGTWGTIVFW